MAKRLSAYDAQRANVLLTGTVVAVVVVVSLFWARAIFVPLALAIFLAFLLSPLVTWVQRYRIRRAPAVLVLMLGTVLLLGGVGWIVTRELVALVNELPEYSDNIEAKVESLHDMVDESAHSRFGKLFSWRQSRHRPAKDMTAAPLADATPSDATAPDDTAVAEKPSAPEPVLPPETPFTPEGEVPPWLASATSLVGSLIESLGMLAMASVLSIFMLIKRENLRDRLLRLMGRTHITATTKALDDAAQRISHFLLMQLIVNASFGVALSLGLYVIGVNYALLWGFLGFMLRYVPYIGAWISAAPPIVLSIIMFEGWTEPLLVLGWILLIELVCSNAIEPWLFGQTLGISEVGLLVAAAFWAFLWGPVGLVLSSPLTACLVILGKYVPQLEFFEILLGDEPALEPSLSFYQRLLARDQDEATQIVLAQAQVSSPEAIYDSILVPALVSATRDRSRDDLSELDDRFILGAIGEIVEDLGERAAQAPTSVTTDDAAATAAPPATPTKKISLLACPARDSADQLALEMLARMLDPTKWEVRIVAVETLAAELVELVVQEHPGVVCIGSLPPGGLAHTRYLCKRLRARLPEARIVVGRWGIKSNFEETRAQLQTAGADQVETTLAETRDHLTAWLPVLTDRDGKAAEEAARVLPPPSAKFTQRAAEKHAV